MSAFTGLKLYPTDADLVRVYDLSAAGRRPTWLRDLNVYSEHPAVLFAESRPTVELKQIHLLWGPIMFADDLKRPVPGGASYKQSGNPVKILDESSGLEIGSCKNFHLWKSGHSTPWFLREYKSSSQQFKDHPFAVYSVCFRSDAYVRAKTRLSKAANALLKSASPLKPNIIPVTPVRSATRSRAKRSTLKKGKREKYKFYGRVEESSIQTSSLSQEMLMDDVAFANDILLASASRPTLTHEVASILEMTEDHSGKEIVLYNRRGDLGNGKEVVMFSSDEDSEEGGYSA